MMILSRRPPPPPSVTFNEDILEVCLYVRGYTVCPTEGRGEEGRGEGGEGEQGGGDSIELSLSLLIWTSFEGFGSQ